MPNLDGTGPRQFGCGMRRNGGCGKRRGDGYGRGIGLNCANKNFASKEEEIKFLESQVSLIQQKITELKK